MNAIAMLNRADLEPIGWADGSKSAFSTDPRRAQPFKTVTEAERAAKELRQKFPRSAGLIYVWRL